MADYPTNLPIFPIVGPNNYPKSADLNARNREIEAIETALGINPKTIDDTVTPEASPADLADILDQFATIVKTMTGRSNWYAANFVQRKFIGGAGAGNQVPSSSTRYIGVGMSGISATENLTQSIVAFRFRLDGLYIVTQSAQSGTGSMVATLRQNNADTSKTITIAAGAAAGTFSDTSTLVEFYPGDVISIKLVNNASASSAVLAGWSADVSQQG